MNYENPKCSLCHFCVLKIYKTGTVPFSYPEPFLRAVRRGALAKTISKLASDWLVLTPDIVFLPCFYGIQSWIWPEPLVAPRVRRALGTRMEQFVLMQIVIQNVTFSVSYLSCQSLCHRYLCLLIYKEIKNALKQSNTLGGGGGGVVKYCSPSTTIKIQYPI